MLCQTTPSDSAYTIQNYDWFFKKDYPALVRLGLSFLMYRAF